VNGNVVPAVVTSWPDSCVPTALLIGPPVEDLHVADTVPCCDPWATTAVNGNVVPAVVTSWPDSCVPTAPLTGLFEDPHVAVIVVGPPIGTVGV